MQGSVLPSAALPTSDACPRQCGQHTPFFRQRIAGSTRRKTITLYVGNFAGEHGFSPTHRFAIQLHAGGLQKVKGARGEPFPLHRALCDAHLSRPLSKQQSPTRFDIASGLRLFLFIIRQLPRRQPPPQSPLPLHRAQEARERKAKPYCSRRRSRLF